MGKKAIKKIDAKKKHVLYVSEKLIRNWAAIIKLINKQMREALEGGDHEKT